jgi:hypothetical protein
MGPPGRRVPARGRASLRALFGFHHAPWLADRSLWPSSPCPAQAAPPGACVSCPAGVSAPEDPRQPAEGAGVLTRVQARQSRWAAAPSPVSRDGQRLARTQPEAAGRGSDRCDVSG